MINNDLTEISDKAKQSHGMDSSRKKSRFNQVTHKKDIKRRIGEVVLSILEDYENPHDALRFFCISYMEIAIMTTDCSIGEITGIVSEILEGLVKIKAKHD